MTAKQVGAIRAEFYRAITDGLAFNRFVTIHWGALGLADIEAARATGRLVKLASDWCATKGVKMAYAWVRENDDGDASKGSHVHIALHCPASLPIGRMWRRWLRRITGKRYGLGAVLSRVIGPRLDTYASNPELYRSNLDVVLGYFCKGIDPGIGGRIIGKRVSLWQRRD